MNLRLNGITAALSAVLVSYSLVHAGDIILNGNFQDGKTHWHGDGDVSDAGGSLVITLNPDKWTAVYQDFSAEVSQMRLKITYSYSDDCTLAKPRSADTLLPPFDADALEAATGLQNSIGSLNLPNGSSWMVVMASGGSYRGEHPVRDTPGAAKPRTYSTTLSEWRREFNRDDLCLAFPPGKGTVTITSVEAIPPPQ